MPGDRSALDLTAAHQQVNADRAYLQGVWLRLAKTTLIIEGARLAFSDSLQVLNRDGQANSFASSNGRNWMPGAGLSPDGNNVGPSGET
jgi:hypothetical protein